MEYFNFDFEFADEPIDTGLKDNIKGKDEKCTQEIVHRSVHKIGHRSVHKIGYRSVHKIVHTR